MNSWLVLKIAECSRLFAIKVTSKTSRQHQRGRHSRLKAFGIGMVLSTLLFATHSAAKDTETFFAQVSTDSASAENAPNIIFVLDDSHSMLKFDRTSESRLERLKSAMYEILRTAENVNIGITTMNGENGGGAIRYPVTAIDKPLCEDGSCYIEEIRSVINDVNDDTEESLGDKRMSPGGLQLSSESGRMIGLRFGDIGIPQGAKITSAVLELNAGQTNSSGANFTVRAHDTDDAAAFTEVDGDLSSRPLTAGKAVFSAGKWSNGGDYSYDNADLAAIIQELVERPGWCAGSNVALLLQSTLKRSINSLENVLGSGTGSPASLRVTYDASELDFTQERCYYDTLSLHVFGGSDDTEERLANGRMTNNNILLQIPLRGNDPTMYGFRFNQFQVEQGTEIVEARVEFTAGSAGSGTPEIKISAVDVDNAGRPGSGLKALSSLDQTDTSVSWASPSIATIGDKLFTSDITSVVQEVLDRPGWKAGNSMVILFEPLTGNSGFHGVYSFNRGLGTVPILYTRVKRFIKGVEHLDGRPEYTARDELLRIIRDLRVNMYTPMLGSQFEAAQYMLGREVDYGLSRGVAYNYSVVRVSHPNSHAGGRVVTPPNCNSSDPYAMECLGERIVADGAAPVTYTSPMLDSCQSNHMVLLGDGATHLYAINKIRDLTGTTCSGKNCGPALSQWLWENDHAPHIEGKQEIYTHTVAFNLSGNSSATAFYRDIAQGGRTELREADSAAELATAFTSIIEDATSINTGFTSPSATVNQFNRLSHREDVYITLFEPSDSAVWNGNLKRYKLGAASAADSTTSTEFIDVNGNPVTDADTGYFQSTARSFWQNINDDGSLTNDADGAIVRSGGAAVRIGVNGIDSRKIYTFTGDNIPVLGANLADGNHDLHEDNPSISAQMLGVSEDARDELLMWARGMDRKDVDKDDNVDEPRRRLGDPLHSSPVLVNYRENDIDSSVVFVGTNEGVLHAIDSDTGNERWAFSPQELMQNHKTFYTNSSSESRPHGLDGGVTLWRDENNNNFAIESGESAYLFIGMRRGGANYYALDVSDKNNPRLMWVIKGGPDGTPGFEELGQSWSPAKHARMVIDGTPTDVLIFGAGYDVNQDADPRRATDGNTVVMNHTEDSVGRGIFIVKADSGDLLWSVGGPALDPRVSVPELRKSSMRYSIPAGIRTVDIDSDGLVDQLYASDTGGQVWRFDVIGDGSGGSDLLQGGVVAQLSDSTNASGHRRFYTEPDVALIQNAGQSFMAVSIGSGWRAHPLNDLVDDAQYVIRLPDVRNIPDGYGREVSSGNWEPITEEDLVLVNDTTANDALDYSYGWYLRLPDAGEKVMSTSVIFQNTVYFTSYVPAADTSDCAINVGGGYAYALSVIDGKPVLDFSGDGDINTDYTAGMSEDMRYELQHEGIPPSPAVLIGKDKSPEVFVGIEGIPTDSGNLTSRTFWVDTGD